MRRVLTTTAAWINGVDLQIGKIVSLDPLVVTISMQTNYYREITISEGSVLTINGQKWLVEEIKLLEPPQPIPPEDLDFQVTIFAV